MTLIWWIAAREKVISRGKNYVSIELISTAKAVIKIKMNFPFIQKKLFKLNSTFFCPACQNITIHSINHSTFTKSLCKTLNNFHTHQTLNKYHVNDKFLPGKSLRSDTNDVKYNKESTFFSETYKAQVTSYLQIVKTTFFALRIWQKTK